MAKAIKSFWLELNEFPGLAGPAVTMTQHSKR
jgi:hypothetical protein